MIETSMPDTFTAGNSLNLQLSFPDYSALDGWNSKLFLNGGTPLNTTGSISDTGFLYSISSTRTANMTVGLYNYTIVVYTDSEQHTAQSGFITVLANPNTQTPRMAHVDKMINAIEAVMEGRVTDDVSSISIAGRSITNLDINELLNLRAYYYKERYILNTGNSSIRTVKIEFSNPT